MARKLIRVPVFVERYYPGTEASFRWLLFKRKENDLSSSGTVVQINRRLYIDLEKWDEWVSVHNAEREVA